MNKVGLFFGTDTGTTRLIGKKIAKKLGEDLVDKPLNINRTSLDDFMSYDVMILGTATYGEGQLPGIDTKVKNGSWQEFVPQLESQDLSGKVIALYGVGNQDKYGDRYCNAMYELYNILKEKGASFIGAWDTEGYTFSASKAVVDGKFVGLAIDNKSQLTKTDERLAGWTELVKPQLMAALKETEVSAA